MSSDGAYKLLKIADVRESGVYKYIQFEDSSMVLRTATDSIVNQFGIDTRELVKGREVFIALNATLVSDMKLVQKPV